MNSSTKTVLLTGASGFLGSVFRSHLERSGFKVLTLGRHMSDIPCDLGTEVPVLPSTIDYVVHAAGKAHVVPKTKEESDDFFRVNVTGTQNLLSGLDQSGSQVKAIVFISSVAVYGLIGGHLISEDHPLEAKDPYGLSKIRAEELIAGYGKAHNIHYCLLRLPLIAGPNPPGNLGAMVSAIRKGWYLSVGNGDVKKSVVFASDVAEFLPQCFEHSGIYNLTDGYHPTFRELETALAGAMGKSAKIRRIPGFLAGLMALCGDLLGKRAPINSLKLKKIQSELTFSDQKAVRELNWSPHQVHTNPEWITG